MSVMNFVGKLFATQKQQRADEERSWRELVKSVAEGAEQDPVETLGELQRLGKTPADLQAAVMKHDKRKELAAKLAAVPEIEAEIKKVEAEGRKAIDQLEAAEKKFQPAIDNAVARVGFLNSQLQAAEAAREELIRTGSDPAVQARLDQLGAELRELNQEIAQRKDVLKSKEYSLSAAKARRQNSTDLDNKESLAADISRLTLEIGEIDTKLLELAAAAKALQDKMDQERLVYLDPACVG